MINDKYFEIDKETPHKNPEENFQIRKEKAFDQIKRKPARLSQILDYVSEFLMCLEKKTEEDCDVKQIDTISLDSLDQTIIDNGIIARECNWTVPVWNQSIGKYSVWEPKYSCIQRKFGLSHTRNILWMKFTKKGYLGVIAKGMDINFYNDNTSGKLVNEIGDSWDESFVLVFPLTDNMLNGREVGDIERALGNFLISKQVPIIDFYSHNY